MKHCLTIGNHRHITGSKLFHSKIN